MSFKTFSMDIFQSVVLFIVFSVASIIFSKTFSNLNRFSIILFCAVFYVAWGCWHHYTKDRLNKLVVIEYTLVALLITALAALGLGVVRFF